MDHGSSAAGDSQPSSFDGMQRHDCPTLASPYTTTSDRSRVAKTRDRVTPPFGAVSGDEEVGVALNTVGGGVLAGDGTAAQPPSPTSAFATQNNPAKRCGPLPFNTMTSGVHAQFHQGEEQASTTFTSSRPPSSVPPLVSTASSSALANSASSPSMTKSLNRPSSAVLVSPFPCQRIDKCKWSLLDETVCKLINGKSVLSGHRRVWKSRRMTLNSGWCRNNDLVTEKKLVVCLHMFKSADPSAVETERLTFDGNSFAAVTESNKEYGGGKWIIKVAGLHQCEQSSTSAAWPSMKQHLQRSEWLIQFDSCDRLQVWLRLLKSLLTRVKEADQAFRRGQQSRVLKSLSRSNGTIWSMDAIPFGRPADLEDKKEGGPYLNESVEELVSSTESLVLRRPRGASLSFMQQRRRRGSSAPDQASEEHPPRMTNVMTTKPRSATTSGAFLRHSKSTPLTSLSETLFMHTGLPTSPLTPPCAFPLSSTAMTPPSRADEERFLEWDSESATSLRSSSSSSSSSSFDKRTLSSLTSPTTSSQASDSSPSKRDGCHQKDMGSSNGKKKGLRLELRSLRRYQPQLQSGPDSPTDPATPALSISDYSQDSCPLLSPGSAQSHAFKDDLHIGMAF